MLQRKLAVLGLAILMVACRGKAPHDPMVTTAEELTRLVDSLMPSVAASAQLQFKWTPKSQIRSVEQLRSYLLAKLENELPPEKLEGIGSAYRLLGMIPDTLDLMALFKSIYAEQVAGYYDPDSSSLYFVSRGEPTQLRFLLAHEMTHALQHQYLPLDSLMKSRTDGDRTAASQSMLEGQAQLVAFLTLLPGQGIMEDETFLDTVEEQMRAAQRSMPIFSAAPLVVREGLVAPYLHGTEFVRWYRVNHPGDQPFGPWMPVSTEQILHPDHYASGDQPVGLRFTDSTNDVMHEDTFGELEITVLRSVLAGINEVPTDVAMEWGGDRYRVFKTPDGPALVWFTVWDTPGGANRFYRNIGEQLLMAKRAGYLTKLEQFRLGAHHGVRVVVAPANWSRWGALPRVEVRK